MPRAFGRRAEQLVGCRMNLSGLFLLLLYLAAEVVIVNRMSREP